MVANTTRSLHFPLVTPLANILGGREFSHGLGSLRHGVLGELSGKHQTNRRLNLARRQRALLVVRAELSSFPGNALEDVVDEGVHDGHPLLADSRVGVHLLEHLVDVSGIGLNALLATFLLVAGGLHGFGGSLLAGCFRHAGRKDVCLGAE